MNEKLYFVIKRGKSQWQVRKDDGTSSCTYAKGSLMCICYDEVVANKICDALESKRTDVWNP